MNEVYRPYPEELKKNELDLREIEILDVVNSDGLGLVHGYEVWRRINEGNESTPYSGFSPASLYRKLRALSARNLLQRVPADSVSNGPQRSYNYGITDEGRQALFQGIEHLLNLTQRYYDVPAVNQEPIDHESAPITYV